MKKLCTAVFLLLVGIVLTAIFFSPLTAVGEPYIYVDNAAVRRVDGLCYASGDIVRVDFSGDEDDMYAALERIGAETVKTAHAGGTLIVYAYSARVCSGSETTENGESYNVMAAYSDGKVSIGTPVLSGSY
ncbi:MAG: hypothetical protein NC184_04615 [Roseburia sp.]|nr:hypothetical protein [Roseburia sp.]